MTATEGKMEWQKNAKKNIGKKGESNSIKEKK